MDHGCTVELMKAPMEVHERVCPFRLVPCVDLACQQKICLAKVRDRGQRGTNSTWLNCGNVVISLGFGYRRGVVEMVMATELPFRIRFPCTLEMAAPKAKPENKTRNDNNGLSY